jgi:hypothetical protein
MKGLYPEELALVKRDLAEDRRLPHKKDIIKDVSNLKKQSELRSNPKERKIRPRIRFQSTPSYYTTASSDSKARTVVIRDKRSIVIPFNQPEPEQLDIVQVKNFRFIFNYMIQDVANGKEFITIYCLFKRLNKTIANEINVIKNYHIPLLYSFIEPLKGVTVSFEKKKYGNYLKDIKEQLYNGCLYENSKSFDRYTIESKYNIYYGEFIVKLLLCVYFFNMQFKKMESFTEVKMESDYKYLVIRREITPNIVLYLPLLKSKNKLEKTKHKDKIMSTPWQPKSSAKIMNRNIFNSRCKESTGYFENLIGKLHTILFPPMNVK